MALGIRWNRPLRPTNGAGARGAAVRAAGLFWPDHYRSAGRVLKFGRFVLLENRDGHLALAAGAAGSALAELGASLGGDLDLGHGAISSSQRAMRVRSVADNARAPDTVEPIERLDGRGVTTQTAFKIHFRAVHATFA